MAGPAAGQTWSQAQFEGYMSTPEGWQFFVNYVLPDVISGSTKIQTEAGSNLGAVAPLANVVMAVQAVGNDYALSIPQQVMDQVTNPPPKPETPVQIPTTSPADKYQSAKDIVKDFLGQWGLSSETDWAYGLVTGGASSDQVLLQLRGRDAYKHRFGGLVELQKKGIVMSEGEALNWEKTMSETLTRYGVTPGTYQLADYQRWIGEGKSVAEQSSRLAAAADVAYSEPPEVRGALDRLYGIHGGDLTAWALNDQGALPALQRKIDASKVAASAQTARFGTLSATQAERIASLLSPEQAAPQLSKLGQQSALYLSLPGEGGDFTLDDVIEGYFGGNADKLNAIRRRLATRQAEFSGSGAVAQSEKGAYGAGVARST